MYKTYVKVNNGVVEQYPYTLFELRQANPSISFPRDPKAQTLANFGVYEVALTEKTVADYTKNVEEGDPQEIDGVWTQVWNVTGATPSPISERTERKAEEVRERRDLKLANSDWTQVADAPVDQQAWAAYRQALRDVPAQAGHTIYADSFETDPDTSVLWDYTDVNALAAGYLLEAD